MKKIILFSLAALVCASGSFSIGSIRQANAGTFGYVGLSFTFCGSTYPFPTPAQSQVQINSNSTSYGSSDCRDIGFVSLNSGVTAKITCGSNQAITATGPTSIACNASGPGRIKSVQVSIVPSAPSCTVSPASPKPGDTVTIDNAQQGPNGGFSLAVSMQTGSAAPIAIVGSFLNQSQTFSMNFQVPANTPAGQYAVNILQGSYNVCGGPLTLTVTKPVSTAPSNLTATMNISSPGKVSLAWTDNVTNETGFQVERATDLNQTSFVLVGTTKAAATSYVDDLSPIAQLTAKESYRVRATFADGTFSDYSSPASVSNCLIASGNGIKKIVFMRDTNRSDATGNWTPDIAGYVSIIQAYINNGFAKVDPFKSYYDQFAFSIDLAPYSSDKLPGSIKPGIPFSAGAANSLRQASVCGSDALAYVYVTGAAKAVIGDVANAGSYAFVLTGGDGTVFINEAGKGKLWDAGDEPLVVIHELGHALGGLSDEYNKGTEDILTYAISGILGNGGPAKNCSTNPNSDFTYNNIWYGSPRDATTAGCWYDTSIAGNTYYRSTPQSIMNNAGAYNSSGNTSLLPRFNVISCGYVVAALRGEPTDKPHAQLHWPAVDQAGGSKPGCMAMDTEKSNIPPVLPAPVFKSISKTTLSPGDPTITGTGFSTTNNAVTMKNASGCDVSYDITGIPSPDGTSISFNIPTSTVAGKYVMQAGAFNSPWSTSKTITVLGNNKCQTPSTPSQPSGPAPLDASGLSCTVAEGRTALNATYTFNGSPTGGMAPYTYTLKGTSSGSLPTTVTATITSVPGIFTPGNTYLKNVSSATLTVKSADNQTDSVSCVVNKLGQSYDWGSFMANVLGAFQSLFPF